MKKTIGLILFLLMITAVFPQEKRFIGVLKLEQASLSEEDANILTDRLRYELFKSEKFTVLERDKMEDIMTEQSFQMSGCTSNECMVEVGKLIGVNEIVGGSIGKFGNTFTVNVRLIDVETGQITANAVFDLNGSKDDLLTIGMKKVARELAGLKTIDLPQTASGDKVSITDATDQQQKPATQVNTDSGQKKSATNEPVSYPRQSVKKPRSFKYFAIYPSLGNFASEIKSDQLFDNVENTVTVDFDGTLAGVMGEVFLTKKLGVYLGIFSSSKTFDKLKDGAIDIEFEYDIDVTMFYYGIDWKPIKYASLGFGGTTFQIKGTYEGSAFNVTRKKTINDKGVLIRAGVHVPLTDWLQLNTYANITGGEKLNGAHFLYSASIHF